SNCSSCGTCTTKFPDSVMKKINFNSTQGFQKKNDTVLHIIIATNQSDWDHDPFLNVSPLSPNSHSSNIVKLVKSWCDNSDNSSKINGKIKCSVSDIPFDDLDQDSYEKKSTNILILPFFIWVKKIHISNCTQILNLILDNYLNYINDLNTNSNLNKINLTNLIQNLNSNYNFGKSEIQLSNNRSYIFLCSHKTRDKRCGITAPIIKKEINLYLKELDLYRSSNDDRPGGINVYYVNHVGGHKFAANMLIFNKTGEIIWLGKLIPKNVRPVIDQSVLNGKIFPEFLRSATK
ncbi:Apd1p ASCRUDRAFT_19300, partial [Ascoidea rubescens DSM 1968]